MKLLNFFLGGCGESSHKRTHRHNGLNLSPAHIASTLVWTARAAAEEALL